jgi:hypothetical protein
MTETGKPGAGASGPVLASLFTRTAGLARIAALFNALLCGVATDRVIAMIRGCNSNVWGLILGLLVAIIVYVALAPESMVTGCLVSARKCFLDNEVTRSECTQMRKKCLRKSLLY